MLKSVKRPKKITKWKGKNILRALTLISFFSSNTNLFYLSSYKKFRSKLHQSKVIGELKSQLKSKEIEQKQLYEQSMNLDIELKKSRNRNDNLRVKVEKIEEKLSSVKKELATKTKEAKSKLVELKEFQLKWHRLSHFVSDFNELKKQLVALTHEYRDPKNRKIGKKRHEANNLSLEERQIDLLRKEIRSRKEIMDTNNQLHQARLRKLKRDQITLKIVSVVLSFLLFSYL